MKTVLSAVFSLDHKDFLSVKIHNKKILKTMLLWTSRSVGGGGGAKQGCQHYEFFRRSTEFRNDPYFSRCLYRVLTFSEFLRILQFFDFFQHFFFEYKYIWRDWNTSFSKMCGRYDKACCSDNFNRKKVIIHGYRWALVSDCIPAFVYYYLWLQAW